MAVRTNDVTQISSELISTPIPTVYCLSTILNEARERKVISTTISLAAGSGLLVCDSRKREEHTCINEPRCEKTGLRGFRPGPTQTGLCSHRRRLEA